jgi:hypothetical protein
MCDTACTSRDSRCRHHDDGALCERVQAEFREMPGLKLTLRQASRLFAIDPLECEHVLTTLVRDGELATNGKVFSRG